MNTNALTIATALSDRDLLTRLIALAGREREASVELVAHLAALAPQPDARSLVRKLPAGTPMTSAVAEQVGTIVPPDSAPAAAVLAVARVEAPRPSVRPTAPERYRVQFTIGEATHEKLRRLQ